MNTNQALQYVNAQALTPDQLLSYVQAVSGAQSELINDYVVHKQDSHIILVGYSLQNPHDTDKLHATIEQICTRKDITDISVLAPIRPSLAPAHAISNVDNPDAYWFLPLPAPRPNVKVRNMLTRAGEDIYINTTQGQGAWSGAHQEMMLDYIRRKGMDTALCSILQRLSTYVITTAQVEIFSAYAKNNDTLLAFALGDFSSFSTAFYMFAFRSEQASPGVADAVLLALLNAASSYGHSQCNLGLGINEGIRFFKKKWGAKPNIPFVQTKWQIKSQKKSWFSRWID